MDISLKLVMANLIYSLGLASCNASQCSFVRHNNVMSVLRVFVPTIIILCNNIIWRAQFSERKLICLKNK